MSSCQTIDLPIRGMDCAECAAHVRKAIAALDGVESVEVLLSSEKAVIRIDPARVDISTLEKAVENAGYSVPASAGAVVPGPAGGGLSGPAQGRGAAPAARDLARAVLILFGVVFGAVLFVVALGEWLGLLEAITGRVPLPFGLAVVLAGGAPVFRNVIRATLRRQVTSHTLMTLGVIAALSVGEWATAAVVVFFMRIGDYAERFTAERARRAVRGLSDLAPETARVERDGSEREVPVAEVRVGETVVVRPGEKIPVDGEVIAGEAAVDQATITGESMPVDVAPGTRVYAASFVHLGGLRLRATHVGRDSTFGRVIAIVEEAEANRGTTQRVADRFSTYFLPLVVGIAGMTLFLRHDPLSAAAVLVVACSCSFALATPMAMLASIGAGARQGLLIKGGKYLESLASADTLLIDKTGTITLGRPQLTDVVSLGDRSESELLALAASAERYSEHPLARAVCRAARERNLPLDEPEDFVAVPGMGVRARVTGRAITIGNRRMIGYEDEDGVPEIASNIEAAGKTVLFVACDGHLDGVLAAADTLRPEAPEAIAALRDMGIRPIELLTGDNERAAAPLARSLGIGCRADLLPEDKIAIVKEYQARGHRVVMVGDGVNDAPALAQAEVGIAMGAAGSEVAIEAGHMALMREDWALVPEVFRIARRTMGVVRLNIAFTAVYNLVGLTLAAVGILPPILAAAAQSLPDLGILANSSRLLRHR